MVMIFIVHAVCWNTILVGLLPGACVRHITRSKRNKNMKRRTTTSTFLMRDFTKQYPNYVTETYIPLSETPPSLTPPTTIVW